MKKRIARALKNPGRYRDGGPNGVPGLMLVVENERNASWTLRYQRGLTKKGKRATHDMGLGPLWLVKELEAARELARTAREQLRIGIDPIAARRAEKAAQKASEARALTFRAAAEAFFDQHERKWSNATHRRQFLSSLSAFAFPILGDMPVATIDVPLVLQVLEQKVAAHRGRPVAAFVIRAMFDRNSMCESPPRLPRSSCTPHFKSTVT
jgi:hypothetical protein